MPPSPLADARFVADHLDDPSVVVVDVRWYLDGRKGKEAFEAGRVPGARFLDLDADLARPRGEGPGRHPLPRPEDFARALARVGVSPDTTVVAYDDAGGSVAARLWWLLRASGFEGGRILDGGLQAFLALGIPLEEGAPPEIPGGSRAIAPLPVSIDPRLVASRDDVRAALSDPSVLLLDARARPRYEGEIEPIDPRPGHVPGARSAPFSENLDPSGRFLPREALAARYAALGALGEGAAREVIVYCGSGVTACHDVLALALAGRPDARLYEGSWSDWSSDPALPAALGPEP